MHSINIIDPTTGQSHSIPYDELPHALEAGGQFADEEQKNKALSIQNGTYSNNESSVAETPFNPKKPLELELTKPKGNQETMGWKGVKEDAINMLRNSLKSGIGFARKAPGNLKEIGSEFVNHPLSYPPHVAQQILSSLGSGAKGLLNIPHEAINELGKKDIIPEWLKKYNELPFTHIPEDTGVEKFLGLEPTKKSDEFIRALPALYGGGKLIGEGISSVKKALNAPNKETLFRRALEERVSQAAKNKSISEEDLKALQDALTLDYSNIHGDRLGETTPLALREGIHINEHKLAKKEPFTKIPERDVGDIPPEPDLKAIVNEKKEAVEKAKNDVDQALGTLDNPRLKGAEKVAKAIKDVHAAATDLYKSARQHYIDKKISADNTAEIKDITKDLEALKDSDELAPGYGSGTAEQKSLESQLDTLKGEKVNASDIFDLQRTLEKMANDTRKKQFSGVNALEFNRLNNLADRLESHADKLAKRLEAVGGKDVQKLITEANKGWRTWKDLSDRNPVGKGALQGEIPMRTMIDIAKKHPGNDFLKALIDSDPELKKHVLAAYAGESNANKLLRPHSLTKQYIKDLPEVEEHVNALKEALQGVKEGEVKASRVKKEYDDLVSSMKDAAKEQKVRRDAIEESDKLKQQIKFKEDAIPKIEDKIKNVQAHSAEHDKLKKELAEHKKFIQDKGGRLKDLAKFFVKVKGANLIHM